MVIEIDYKKCRGAEKCGLCLKNCPTGVYMNVPIGEFVPNKAPEKYKIVPAFEKDCTGCKTCLKLCPEKCIRFL